MFRLSVGFLAGLIVSYPGTCAPVISPRSILNAASFQAPGLPAGSIAQGSLFTIFGSGIGPATGSQQSSFPLQTTFGGVSIQVTQGTTTVNAIPVFVVQGQVNALMPSNAPLGWASLRLTFNSAPSNPSPVYIVHDSAGIFSVTGTGIGPAVLQNALSATSLPVNSNQASAKPGQTEVLYLTGLGPITTPDNLAPPAGNLATPVEVWVGGVAATVSYSGRSPCCSGLDQIDFVVPANAPQGCWVPVYVRTSHATVSNFTSMAISSNGGSCLSPSDSLSSGIVSGGGVGSLYLTRVIVHEDVGVNAPVDVSDDYVSYRALKPQASPWAFVPFLSSVPQGTCAVYPGVGDFFSSGNVPQAATASLDGGKSLTISGSAGTQSATLLNGIIPLGGNLPLYSLPNSLYLAPGTYTVQSSGGADIGALNTKISVPSPPTWTNRDQTTNVSRSQPLTLNWSGAQSGGNVSVLGINSDLPTNSSAMFVCAAAAGSSSLTVPAEVLSALPASRVNPLASKSVVYLMFSSPSPLTATGLAAGVESSVYIAGKTVVFQ